MITIQTLIEELTKAAAIIGGDAPVKCGGDEESGPVIGLKLCAGKALILCETSSEAKEMREAIERAKDALESV